MVPIVYPLVNVVFQILERMYQVCSCFSRDLPHDNFNLFLNFEKARRAIQLLIALSIATVIGNGLLFRNQVIIDLKHPRTTFGRICNKFVVRFEGLCKPVCPGAEERIKECIKLLFGRQLAASIVSSLSSQVQAT